MTGAPFPSDCDVAVKVEDTLFENGLITVDQAVVSGTNRRNAGEDFSRGDVVIEKGNRVTTGHLMAFAALGINELQVFKKPKIVIIPTGKELAKPGTELKPGQIL